MGWIHSLGVDRWVNEAKNSALVALVNTKVAARGGRTLEVGKLASGASTVALVAQVALNSSQGGRKLQVNRLILRPAVAWKNDYSTCQCQFWFR